MNLCGHFEYAGVQSRQYGLIFANVETDMFSSLSGSISSVTSFNKRNKRNYLIGNDYSEFPLSFEVEILTDDEHVISLEDRREIERWLFSRHSYSQLYLDPADDPLGETYEYVNGALKKLFLFCRFINPTKLEYNGGVVGYKCTLETDSGLLWQDTISKAFALNHTTTDAWSNIVVDVDSDLPDYTYPDVYITMGSIGGDIQIANHTDSDTRYTSFTGLTGNVSFSMKAETNEITGSNYQKFSSQNFIL